MRRRVWSVGQGQGLGTRKKVAALADLFRLILRRTKAPALSGRTYWHLDLNAGCGWNDVADCPGSPLAFAEAVRETGRPARAVFCDSDGGACARLRERLAGAAVPGLSYEVWCCDNRLCLERAAAVVAAAEPGPALAVGSCLCDPNGYRVGFPVDALADFFGTFGRVDFVLSLNVWLMRTARGCRDGGNPGFADWPDLDGGLLPRFGKAHWYARNPPGVPGAQFTTLYGTNAPLRSKSFGTFYGLDTPEGRGIVRGLKRVAPGQRDLFPDGEIS